MHEYSSETWALTACVRGHFTAMRVPWSNNSEIGAHARLLAQLGEQDVVQAFGAWAARSYGLPQLIRGGHAYPLLVAGSPQRPVQFEHDPLIQAPAEWVPDDPADLISSDAFRLARIDAGVSIEPRAVYALDRIGLDANGHVAVRCKLGQYDWSLDTSEALEWEAAQLVASGGAAAMVDPLAHMPLRSKLHAQVGNPAVDGSHRSPAVGISMLVTFTDHAGQEIAILGRRAQTAVATHPGLRHVVPSFVFQHLVGPPEAEFDIMLNARREYMEELFGAEEPKNARPDWFRTLRSDQYLTSMLLEKEATLRIVGVVINPYSLRPELLLHLRILTNRWLAEHSRRFAPALGEHIQINDEFEQPDAENPESPFVAFLPHLSDEDIIQRTGLTADDTVPMAAGAYWMAIDDVRRNGSPSST